jgi:predicted dehydrogenase/threonine dehydrogenase-like Zn-dependent dehydrogenase
MKQVVLRGGKTQVVDVPEPAPAPGSVLVANAFSAISSGTERSMVSTGTGSLAARAIRNPDLVALTLRHAREHGVRETIDRVRGTVSQDLPLGYSSAGTVLDTGGIAELHVGQRVACSGAARANHAETVSVPANLVCAVPEGVSLRDASFSAIGAIALQGIRRAEPSLGERFVVAGLGLVGLITLQALLAAGCRVAGVEPVERRRALGGELGAELVATPSEAAEAVASWTGGAGADAVIVTASAKGDELVNDAVRMLRRKGRVVPVGDVGLGLQRKELYEREADVLISTSYGPGRYDPTYEESGIDYPLPYVRWTAGRNMEEFLRLVSDGLISLDRVVELELPIERAVDAYEALAGGSPPLAAALAYSEQERPARASVPRASTAAGAVASAGVRVALVGAGDLVRSTHLPNLQREEGVRVTSVVSRGGASAASLAHSLDGAQPGTDWREAIDAPDVDLVLVATRHDTHAEIAAAALRAGKAVFLEKPLGLTREQIDEVWAASEENDRLAIGFNRPFSALARRLDEEAHTIPGPTQLVYRVNSPLAPDHWLNDPREGGGRLLGEACHMFDFANWLCGTPERVLAAAVPAPAGVGSPESASVTVQYADGSVATIHYSGLGSAAMPKERIELLRGGRSWELDNFRKLTSYGADGTGTHTSRGGKGHAELLRRVLAATRGDQPFEPGLGAAYMAQSVALAALESISSGRPAAVQFPPERTG